jgi:hypothetical protein
MIQPITAYRDTEGKIHETKEGALTSEIERALGRIGNGDSMTPGFAKRMIEAREALIPLLQEFDNPSMVLPRAVIASVPSKQAA